MSAPSNCCNPCDPATVTTVPGTQGEPGENGADGSDGVNAYTVTTEAFTVPAIGASVTILVANSTWATVGQNIFVFGAGYFALTAKASPQSMTLQYLDYTGNTHTGANISVGGGVSPAGTQPELASALPDELTNNTGGTAAGDSSLAVGSGVQKLFFRHTFIAGTAAVEPVTNYTIGFNFKILSWACVTDVLLVGAAGSRVANMEINSTNVGTVNSTITIPIANAAVGTVTAGTAVSGANTGTPTDTFSIEIAAGGTEFSAGSVTFIITVQNMDTANSFATLTSAVNAMIAALNF